MLQLRIFVLLAALLLAACQSTLPAPTGTPDPQKTPLASPTARVPQVTATVTHTPLPTATATTAPHLDVDLSSLPGRVVELWHPWQGDLAVRVEELARTFQQQNEWGLQVRVRSLYGTSAMADEVELVESGEAPGPVLVAALPEQLASWLQAGQAVDLSGYMAEATWGLSAREVSDFNRVFWDQELGADGQRAGIPALRSARVLFYNQSWAADLGFNQPPATPEEFQEQACAAATANAQSTTKEMRGTGGWLIATDALTTLSWLAAFGAEPIPAREGQPYTFETKEAEQALAFLRKMVEKGCAWEGRSSEPQPYFANRMALFYTGSLQDLPLQARAQEQANSGDSWTILPFPAVEGKPLALTSGFSYGILASAYEDQMAAWLLLRWMVQPHNLALLAEVAPSFPVSTAAEQQLVDYKQNFPWFMILPLQESLRPGPGLASWRLVRSVVEDAGWQVFRLPAEQMRFVLPQMDDLARELLAPR